MTESSGDMFRVQLGPFTSRERAAEVQERLQQQLNMNSFIRHRKTGCDNTTRCHSSFAMIAFLFTGIINVVLTLMKYATTYQHRAGAWPLSV